MAVITHTVAYCVREQMEENPVRRSLLASVDSQCEL